MTFRSKYFELNEYDEIYSGNSEDLLVLAKVLKHIRNRVAFFNHSSLLNDDLLKSPISCADSRFYNEMESFIILFDYVKSVLNTTTGDKYEIIRAKINRMNKK